MDRILFISADSCCDAAVSKLLNVIFLLELLLVLGLLFFGLHLLVFLPSLAPFAGGNRLFIVGGVSILTYVIIGVDAGLLLLRNRLDQVGLFETTTEKWHLRVELAPLHVSVVGFALLATLAWTGLLFGTDDYFIDWLRLEIENVMEKTISGNHHL